MAMGHSDSNHDADFQREKDEKETNMKWCSRYSLGTLCVSVCVCVCVHFSPPIFGIYLASLKELSPESVSRKNPAAVNKTKLGNRKVRQQTKQEIKEVMDETHKKITLHLYVLRQ